MSLNFTKFQIGKNGITPGTIESLLLSFKNHKRVKIVLLKASGRNRNEWTRKKRIKEEMVPQDVRPKKIDQVGRYALNISWADGHDTGIYTFELLRSLCECQLCKSA